MVHGGATRLRSPSLAGADAARGSAARSVPRHLQKAWQPHSDPGYVCRLPVACPCPQGMGCSVWRHFGCHIQGRVLQTSSRRRLGCCPTPHSARDAPVSSRTRRESLGKETADHDGEKGHAEPGSQDLRILGQVTLAEPGSLTFLIPCQRSCAACMARSSCVPGAP